METSSAFPDSFFRVVVKGICVENGKLLLQHESEELGGRWELPGGGLDFGESPKEGLKREVKEETNLEIKSISSLPVYVWTHRFDHKRELEWFYSLALGYRIELKDFNFTPSQECTEIGWFSKEELEERKNVLTPQSNVFASIFNPDDFKESL